VLPNLSDIIKNILPKLLIQRTSPGFFLGWSRILTCFLVKKTGLTLNL